MRVASTSASRWRWVKSPSASGSSQGNQPNSFCVKAVGALLSAWVMTASVMLFLRSRAHGRGGQRTQAAVGANLEGQEGDELRQRDDVIGRPACIKKSLQCGWFGVAW